MTPAIFLDRDGVIIRNRPNYVLGWSDVYIYPQAIEILGRVSSLPYRLVVVTNQSAVGRGLMTMGEAQEINRRLRVEVQRAGGRIDGIYMCPHSPQDNCDCRKPKPGLLLRAAEELSLDLTRSIMVGDALTDLEAARVAGVPKRGLVRTGRGNGQLALPEAARLQPLAVYDGLAAALEDMLALIKYSQESTN